MPNIWMQKRRQYANHLQHTLRLAEEECLHDNTVESEPSMSATPSQSLPLPPPLQPPMPPPRRPPPYYGEPTSQSVTRLSQSLRHHWQAQAGPSWPGPGGRAPPPRYWACQAAAAPARTRPGRRPSWLRQPDLEAWAGPDAAASVAEPEPSCLTCRLGPCGHFRPGGRRPLT